MTLGEKMANAGLNTLMGMGVVFLVLILISFIIYLFTVFGDLGKKAAEKKASKIKKNEPEKVEEPVVEEYVDDTELVAVIAAAIASYEGTSADGVIVRSIRKVNANNKWKRG